MNIRTAALLALAPLPVAATAAAQSVASVRQVHEIMRGYLVKSADQMPEADYAFKPTPEVRSFGQIIGHVAGAAYLLCSTALGEKSPAGENDFEKTTGKAALVKVLNDAFAYCDGAYTMADTKAAEPAEIFGMKGTRLMVLTLNTSHESEHYGNLITYFRLKKMVPPSSRAN